MLGDCLIRFVHCSTGLSVSREGSVNLGSTGLNSADGSPYLTPHRAKKRKLSQDSSNVHVKQEPGIRIFANVSVPFSGCWIFQSIELFPGRTS